MKNNEVFNLLTQMRQLLELSGENRFKIRAYENAAQTVSELADAIEDLAAQDKLGELPGIGKGISDKIKEYCATGKVQEHEKLKKNFPEGLLEMMQISGLGPKRIRIVFDKLKIDSVAKLKAAAEKGQLGSLEGFGKKIEENILKGIAYKQELPNRILLHEARKLSAGIVKFMQGRCRSLEQCVPAGSVRRWKETIGDLDFLCISDNPQEVIQAFVSQAGVKQVLAQGDTKASVIHAQGIQCDLRVVRKESFGAALLYFTGSKEHNVELRELAMKKGLTINEYGVFKLSNKNRPVAGKTEEEIYKLLGLAYIPPELRENRGEIAAAAANKLPKLIEEKDVRGDFHNHTHLSDGAHSLEQMAEAAKAKGWEWFVSADHSQSLKIARGLSVKDLLAKKAAIAKLNKGFKNFKVLLGSEVDILADGSMDYDLATLRQIDFVVASVHTGFKQDEETLTMRLMKAMQNPAVDIIGHLTGRLIGSRQPYPVNVQKILEEAKRTETAIEMNGQPQRMDLYDVHAKQAANMGVAIALTTDAHATNQLDHMTYAVSAARRAWLTADQVLNCRSLSKLQSWKGAASD